MKLREDAHPLERDLVETRRMHALAKYSTTEVADILFEQPAERTRGQDTLEVDEESMTAMQYLVRDNTTSFLVIFLISYLPEKLFFNDHVGFPALLEMAVGRKARLSILELVKPELLLLHWITKLAKSSNRLHAARFNSRIAWLVSLNPARITHEHITTIHPPTGETILSLLFRCRRLAPTCIKHVLAITPKSMLQTRHRTTGFTLLHLAASSYCSEAVVKHLLDRLLLGTIRETSTGTGDTALHMAVLRRQDAVCRLILTYDLHVADIKNREGFTAPDLCDAELLEAILRKEEVKR